MDERHLAYIAGFIDGEGSITFRKMEKGYPVIRIAVYQTEREPLDFMARVLGCGIVRGPYARSESNLGKKPRYVYTIGRNQEVVNVLNHLMPFLIVKKVKAKEALEFWRLNPSRGSVTIPTTHKNCTHDRSKAARKLCRAILARQDKVL